MKFKASFIRDPEGYEKTFASIDKLKAIEKEKICEDIAKNIFPCVKIVVEPIKGGLELHQTEFVFLSGERWGLLKSSLRNKLNYLSQMEQNRTIEEFFNMIENCQLVPGKVDKNTDLM